MRTPSRNALSLIELLIVLAILGLLIALTLPAIQRVRESARRTESLNNLKRIGIALQMFHDSKGNLPGVMNMRKDTLGGGSSHDLAALNALVPYIESEPPALAVALVTDEQRYAAFPHRKVFQSPSDPTYVTSSRFDAPSSYALNYTAIEGRPQMANGFPDGLSNTIAAVEIYFRRLQLTYPKGPLPVLSKYNYHLTNFDWETGSYVYASERRAGFADRGGCEDVYPVTFVGPDGLPRTRASVPGQTFQVKPTLEGAWSGVPQTPFAAGLPTLLFDGSVRTLRPSIDEYVFWAAVTRDKGEVLTDW